MENTQNISENVSLGAWLNDTEPMPEPEALRPSEWAQFAIGDAHIRAALEKEQKS
jgi:hypothetical protein